MALFVETADTIASFLAKNMTAEEFEAWIVSILDEDSLSDNERDALWEIRLLLVEAGEGLRPAEEARSRAAELLATAQ